MGNGIIRYIIESVLNVIYCTSENCLVCNAYLDSEETICNVCKEKIEYCLDETKLNNNVECFSAAYYASSITEMIKRLKYKSDFAVGEFLGSLLIKTIDKNKFEFDLITYVPMSKKALKKRGFNQSKFLADYISKYTNKATKELLIKKKDTKDQIGLDGNSRWNNLKGCFQALKNDNYKNKNIIILDDVITTGATAFYCAEQLLNNGAAKVTILTVAKSRL